MEDSMFDEQFVTTAEKIKEAPLLPSPGGRLRLSATFRKMLCLRGHVHANRNCESRDDPMHRTRTANNTQRTLIRARHLSP
jgi:hypothetical protein